VLLPAALAVIPEAYPDALQRARAIAIVAIGGAVASAAGPVVGGFLSVISWRAIFFVNVPVGLVALYLLSGVPRSPRRPVPFDWAGQLSAVLGMGALTYGLIEGGAAGFAAPRVVGSLALAVVAVIAFVVSQARGTHPMVPFALFRSRPVVVSISAGFSFVIGFYGLVFLLSLYLQEVRGLSPAATGLTFLPMTWLSVFVNPLSARMAARFGPRLPIATGLFLMAVALLGARHHHCGGAHPGAFHPDAAHWTRRRPVNATRHGAAGRQCPRRTRGHSERCVQHVPAARRRAGRCHLRRPGSATANVPSRPAHQFGQRRAAAARSRHCDPVAQVGPAEN